MKFLPFDNFQIRSNLSLDEVKQALEKEVAQGKTFSPFNLLRRRVEQPYRGEILGNGFKIVRNIRYNNSFIPIITGKITDNYRSTTIEIRMRMRVIVYIFMPIWLGALIAAMMFSQGNDSFPSIIPAAMVLMGYIVIIAAYKYEARKAKKFLFNLFCEQDVLPDTRTPIEDILDKLIRKN